MGGGNSPLFFMTRKTNVLKDHADEKIIFHKQQDVTDILEHNKQARAEQNQLGFGRRVASVPIDVLDAWIAEGIDYRRIGKDPAMKKKFFAKLNDPEWRAFKTYDGRVG